jgi:transcriptional regulator with XRE-family HTH domain
MKRDGDIPMTDLALFIKQKLLEKGVSQGVMSREIGYSQSQVSNLINRKAAFDMEFIIKCQKYFGLDDDDTIKLFESAFSSYDEIIVKSEYLGEERLGWLKVVLVALTLYYRPRMYDTGLENIKTAVKAIRDVLTAESGTVEIPKGKKNG